MFRLVLGTIVILLCGCRVDPHIAPPLAVGSINAVTPDGWPMPVYRFAENKPAENNFVLGRALFYEPMLSADNSISCGSCHQQNAAFAHAGHQRSHGIRDQKGNRNAPGLFNLSWHPWFMHDGGINHIEV